MSTTTTLERRIREALRPIKDHPTPGIVFQDITPVLADAALLHDVIAAMAEPFADGGVTHDEGSSWAGQWRARSGPASCRYGSPGSCRGSE